jgi:hypothetical protein
MTMLEFITVYRARIDSVIRTACGTGAYYDDEEREMWVINDETLFNLSQQNDVGESRL